MTTNESPLTPAEIGAFKAATAIMLRRRVNVPGARCEYRGDSRWPDNPATAVFVRDDNSPLNVNLSSFETIFTASVSGRNGPTIRIPMDEPGPWWTHARDLLVRIQKVLELPEATAAEKRAANVARLHEIFNPTPKENAAP